MRNSDFYKKTVASVVCLVSVVYLMLPFCATYTTYAKPDSLFVGYYISGDRSLYSHLQSISRILDVYIRFDEISNYEWGRYGRTTFACLVISTGLFLASYVFFVLAMVSLTRKMKKFWLWIRISSAIALAGILAYCISDHFRNLRMYDWDPDAVDGIIIKPLPYLYIAVILCLSVFGFSFLANKCFKESSHPIQHSMSYLAVAISTTAILFMFEFFSKKVPVLFLIPSDVRRTWVTFAGNIRQSMPPLWYDPEPMKVRFGGVISILFFCARLAIIIPIVDLYQNYKGHCKSRQDS